MTMTRSTVMPTDEMEALCVPCPASTRLVCHSLLSSEAMASQQAMAMAAAPGAGCDCSVRALQGKLQCLIWQHASAKDVVTTFGQLASAQNLEESQLSFLQCITTHPLGEEFIPPRSYLRQVLKALLASLEEACAADPSAEVLDELYSLYTALLATSEPKGPRNDRRILEASPDICSTTCSEEDGTVSDCDKQDWWNGCSEAQPRDRRAALSGLSWVCELCAVPPEHGPGLLTGADCTEFCYKTFRVVLPKEASSAPPAGPAASTTPSVDGRLSEEQGRGESSAAGPDSSDMTGHSQACVDEVGGESLEAGAGQRLIVVRVTPNLLQGGTGCHLWPASFFLTDVLLSSPRLVAGRSVLELGSGCGLTGLCVSLLPPQTSPSRVVVSDGNDETLANLVHNLRINGVPPRHPPPATSIQAPTSSADAPGAVAEAEVLCLKLKWGVDEEASGLKALRPDVILGADIIYDKSVIPELLALLSLLLGDKAGREEGADYSAPSSCLPCEGIFQEEIDAMVRPPFVLLASVVRDKSTQDEFVAQARVLGLKIAVVQSLSRTHHFCSLDRDACGPVQLYILKES